MGASISYVHPTFTLVRWPQVISVGKAHLHKYITSPIMSEICGINFIKKNMDHHTKGHFKIIPIIISA